MKAKNHSIELPESIATYWAAANAGQSEAASACFDSAAVVHDEGKCHRGTTAIRAWIEDTTRNYHPVVTPLRVERVAGAYHVAGRVSGNFPGSPVELDFVFTLVNQKILTLEIQ